VAEAETAPLGFPENGAAIRISVAPTGGFLNQNCVASPSKSFFFFQHYRPTPELVRLMGESGLSTAGVIGHGGVPKNRDRLRPGPKT
jgi:hypothetical protein